jgi:peptide/nickel transport system permease protein
MSFVFKIPVLPVVMERLMNTVILTMTATLLAIGIGIFFGVVSAWKRHTKVDGAILGLTLTMYSMPAFWLSMIMILLFAVYGRLLPSSGMMSYGTSFGTGVEYVLDVLRHLTLPVTALTAQLLGEYALIMRGSMLDVMTEDYILTARAKGLSEWAVLRKHAFKNAMLPTATLIAINLGYTVSGAIQTETVFNWPGVGRLMYDAVLRLDYPVLQGCFLILAIAVIAANFCADIIYGLIDPRVKTGAAT